MGPACRLPPARAAAALLLCSSLAAPRTARAACDAARPELAGLSELAREYYRSGAFEVTHAQQVADVLVRREELFPLCAAGVLQALLLKLEENMVYEPKAYEELMAAYVRYLQTALEQGLMSVQEMKQWPLMQGLERTDAQRRLLAERRTATSAMVLNFCSSRDRFGELHELRWLMEPPFGDPARAQDEFGGKEMGLLRQTDLYIYLVDAPKCKWLGDSVVEDLKKVAKSVHLVPYRGGPEREEQTAYFKFLSDHYENLPDFTIFVHPDAPEHQGVSFLALRRALKLIHTRSALAHEALGYFPLAQQMVVEPRRTWGVGYAAEWVEFWDHLFDWPWQGYEFGPPLCRWKEHPGTYISGLVQGSQEGLSRALAKELCVAAADACYGVTCGTPVDSEQEEVSDEEGERRGGSCSARVGAEPGGLLESPRGLETSYVKSCGSAHEDADYDIGKEPHAASGGVAAPGGASSALAAGGGAAAYAEHVRAYLAGFAAGDEHERPEGAAQARCQTLGDLCSGYTCDSSRALCTVRSGAKPLPSPAGEVSYTKFAQQEARLAGLAAAGRRQRAPPKGGVGARFQLYTGSQAVVHRDRLRAWPRERLAELGADGPFCSRFSGLYEAVWHAMFGEPLSQQPRERDSRLPMFLKWAVPTYYSPGDEGVV